jgi:anti-anti-sigma regulatory factor
MLRINLLDVADLAIVFCRGTIESREDIDVLRQAVTTKLHKVNVVLDYSEVETFSSEGLTVLAALWHAAVWQGARLAIFNPSIAIYLELRRIHSLCPIAVLRDAELLRLLLLSSGGSQCHVAGEGGEALGPSAFACSA